MKDNECAVAFFSNVKISKFFIDSIYLVAIVTFPENMIKCNIESFVDFIKCLIADFVDFFPNS